MIIWKCAEGHWTTNPSPKMGRGDGPSDKDPNRLGHCPYPCMETIVGWAKIKAPRLQRRSPAAS